jgi:hypothetical protein
MRCVTPFRSRVLPAATTLWFLTAAAAYAQDMRASSWLDRPLVNWNKAGDKLPLPPADGERKQALIQRCQLTPPLVTPAEKEVDAAGWIPFWNVDQQLVRDGIEIIGGMMGADGMCRPARYNLFVFVDGRFAGVLSPTPMTSRLDGSSGVVRMALPLITAEFARYTPSDPLCCPSSRVTVRYRIDRTPAGTVVVPIDVRTTRTSGPAHSSNDFYEEAGAVSQPPGGR